MITVQQRKISDTMDEDMFKFKSIFILVLLFPLFLFTQETSAQTQGHPVFWKSAYNKFSSSDFSIRIGQRYFYGLDPVSVHSDPGTKATTLEFLWNENGVAMSMNMYFRTTENNMWELYDLRVGNPNGSGWIDFSPRDSLGNSISSLVGQKNMAFERIFKPLNSQTDAEIYCKECSFTAFMSPQVPLSSYGYGIDFRIGIPENEIITISTDPMTGYGVNALLVDSSRQIVLDQSNFSYMWKQSDSEVLSLVSQTVAYPDNKCAYDILSPCPNINAQLSGKKPGIVFVQLDILRKSDGAVVASNSFDVKVVSQFSTPTPTPTQTDSPESVQIREELKQLQGEVGQINTQLQKQGEDISLLKRILNSIQNFINKLFRP